ncbi:MAG: MATE family efflux transporter [Bacteroidales bacterium]|nr:MATE family efflux transporter [Bacteroidales bacterium]
MNRDSINFEREDIPVLFRRIFLPTLLGMLCMSAMTITDGAFVGHGAGSDALAAVNIFCPLWLLVSGVGLMLGIGCSVVASIHLAKKNSKAANINFTQTIVVGSCFSLILLGIVFSLPIQTARLMGASEQLMPLVLCYQRWMSVAFPAIFLQSVGLMLIRLDGSPRYAMFCSSLPSIVNVALDYVFLFVLNMGLEGVAIATCTGCWLGGLMVAFYFLKLNKRIFLYPLKWTRKSLLLMKRNITYQLKIGFSAFLGDLSIAMLMFVGNYIFLKYMGENGVAAFAIACYIFPIAFMTGSAIAQSAQPIISFNHGLQNTERVKETKALAVKTALFCSLVIIAAMTLAAKYIVSLFLSPAYEAYQVAIEGLPYISLGFVFFILNVVLIGYYQSIEKPRRASVLSICRCAIFLIPMFMLMPEIAGEKGIWLAMPFSEALTTCLASWLYYKNNRQSV